ncbi:hypothetical protein BaRGS_00014561, partial [Batillaria attramentaria]
MGQVERGKLVEVGGGVDGGGGCCGVKGVLASMRGGGGSGEEGEATGDALSAVSFRPSEASY